MTVRSQWKEVRSAFDQALSPGAGTEVPCSPGTQRELDDLLRHLKDADDFLALDSGSGERPALQPEEMVAGRYRVVACLGSGGMGDVYEVEDHDLGERVALKVLRSPLSASHTTVEHLRREIRHTRRIAHRNVCRHFDLGYDSAREPRFAFLTMEYVRGDMLTDYLRRRGAVTVPEALALAGQLCAGLAAAHREGIVHADLKPQNVMVERDTGRLVILDFGLSRRFVPGGAVPGVERSTMLAGTPAYLAPERYEGCAPSPASDLFSLGILLHELIAKAPPPALRDGKGRRAVAASLPPAWEHAITACLSLNPAERPASAEAVHAMLAPPPETNWRRIMSLGLVATAALTACSGVAVWHRTEIATPTAAMHASKPTLSSTAYPQPEDFFVSGAAYLDRQTLPSVDWAIRSLKQGLLQTPDNATANALLARALERKYELTHQTECLQEAAGPLAKAERLAPNAVETLLSRGLLERSHGDLGRAVSDLRHATTITGASGESWKQLARTLSLSGDVLGAQQAFEEGLERNHSFWGLYQEFGLFYDAHGQLDRAETELLAARQLAPDQPIVLASLGGLYLQMGRLDEAEQTLSSALVLEPSATILSNLGAVELRQRHFTAAVTHLRAAIAITPDDFRIWNNLGVALTKDGHLSEARAAYSRVTSLLQQSLRVTPDDPSLLSELAIYAARSGNEALAEQYEAQALARAPQSAAVHLQVAVVESILGHEGPAVQLVERSLELGEPLRDVAANEDLQRLHNGLAYRDLQKRWSL